MKIKNKTSHNSAIIPFRQGNIFYVRALALLITAGALILGRPCYADTYTDPQIITRIAHLTEGFQSGTLKQSDLEKRVAPLILSTTDADNSELTDKLLQY